MCVVRCALWTRAGRKESVGAPLLSFLLLACLLLAVVVVVELLCGISGRMCTRAHSQPAGVRRYHLELKHALEESLALENKLDELLAAEQLLHQTLYLIHQRLETLRRIQVGDAGGGSWGFLFEVAFSFKMLSFSVFNIIFIFLWRGQG